MTAFHSKTEQEIWNELVQAQESYVQSLSSLDTLLLGNDAQAFDQNQALVEQTMEVRRQAYARFTYAMNLLIAHRTK